LIEDISPADFLSRRDSEEDWQLLDVREPWEIDIARIEQTINIPMAEVPLRIEELDASQPVAVLCHSGARSARVAQYLVQNGFDRVANIAGGIDAWSTHVDESIARY
jgi:rhodanese-related sulfurtransferase